MPDANSSIVVLDQPVATSAAPKQTLPSEGVLEALKMILSDAPLNDVLRSVALLIEAQTEEMLCTIFLLDKDGVRLRYAAGPSLPDAYRVATDGIPIGPEVGSCGAAAFLRKPVFVADVMTHPHFAAFRNLLVQVGLRAAWSSPIMSHDGKVLGTFGMYNREVRYPSAVEMQLIDDASRIAGIAIERHRAQDKLRESERELRQITDAVPQALGVLDPKGGVLYANQTTLDYTGFRAEDVLAPNFRERIFHPEDLDKLRHERKNALENGVPFEFEQRALRKDGQYRWFLIRYNPFRDEHGNVVRWYVAGTDIDELKRTEEKLREDEHELQRTVDAIPHEIVVQNHCGVTLWANQATLEYTGLTLDDVVSPGFRERIFHPDDIERFREEREAALARGLPFEIEQRALGKDGRYRWFLIRYNPLVDDSGKVFRWYATGTDIDDRKRTETLHAAEKRTLEMIADGASLKEVLDQLCSSIDAQVAPSVTTVLLMDADGKHLFQGGGPRVPHEWISAIIPVPVAFEAGLCGTAAFLKERVIVSDVATERNWPDQYRDLAIRSGIRAAWSEPIVTKDKEVLGTFALYSHESRVPNEKDLALIEGAGRVAQIAIERQRSQEALRNALERLRLLFDVQQALVANLDLASLFASLAARLRDVTGCDLIGLSLPDPTNGQLRQRMVNYREGKGLITEGLVVPLYGTASGKAFRTRELVYLDGSQGESPDPKIYDTPEGKNFYQLLLKEGVPSGYFLPLIHKGEAIAVLQLTKYAGGKFKTQQDDFLKALAGQLAVAVANALEHGAVSAARDQLAREQVYLREEIERSSMFEEIVGSSEALRKILVQVAKVAPTDSTVLIQGETGTGKELIARAIHDRSKRSSRAFIRVNCAAIPPSLIASELFGHEKGAFTGATQRRVGRFESADGGTIFLDEIGELPHEAQVALLRVLQEREFERVGGSQSISVDVRVLAATNRDLSAAVSEGTFREDLFYRLNVFPIQLPPLRDRAGDIPLLVEYLVERYAQKAGKKIRYVSKETLDLFQNHGWPGNIRELQNVVERAVILSEADIFCVDRSWLSPPPSKSKAPSVPLHADLAKREKESIEDALREAKGLIGGPKGAAAKLGLPRQTLESKIRKLGIDRYRFKS